MSAPLAYLLTWRTYGTWLHGDPRRSVDWEHNVYGTATLPESPVRTRLASTRMKCPAVLLSDAARECVSGVVVEHCRLRGWDLFTFAVRSNHIHVVVGLGGLTPEAMLAQFKAYATRGLRGKGLATRGAPIWGEGGSTCYLWTPAQVNGACAYVDEGQDVPH